MTKPSHGWRGRGTRARLAAAAMIAALAVSPLAAQETDEAAPAVADGAPEQVADELPQQVAAELPVVAPDEPERGSVTHLPMPRYVSLKVSEGNARRGPSLSHRIDWVFVRRDMPLEITGEYGHWRQVRDRDGAGGWVHYSLLSGSRTVIVTEPLADIRLRPEPGAPVVARAEAGVVARLGDCGPDWCRISADGEGGWIEKTDLWGVTSDERRS